MSAEGHDWLATGGLGCCHTVARLVQELRHLLQIGQINSPSVQRHRNSTKRPRNRIRSRRRPPAIPKPAPARLLSELDPSCDIPPVTHNKQSRHQTEGSLTPSWPLPQRPPVHPFTIHLPDDVLRSIFEYAAADLDTACALALVAMHVRTWVDPILYSRVRLVGLDAIRLFARTIEGTILAEASASTIHNNDTSDESAILQTRIYKPPSFFGCVQSLAIIPQEHRVLLFFRDAVRSANIIIGACFNVIELEASGDFLRRTGVSAELLEPSDQPDGDSEHSTAPNSAGPSTPLSMPQGLERALMRPLYLTLVPPIQNVNFRLSILSNLTHLHYSSTLPRILNYQGTLLTLTHVAFDYPMGVTTTRAEALMQLLRSALAWGVPPNPLEDDIPPTDPPTVDDGQSLSSGDEEGSSHLERRSSQPQLPRRLTQIIVRILLRPRMKDSDRASEVSRQLVRLSQTDFRLVYFESQGLFGKDIWERAKVAAGARERRSTSWYRDSLS